VAYVFVALLINLVQPDLCLFVLVYLAVKIGMRSQQVCVPTKVLVYLAVKIGMRSQQVCVPTKVLLVTLWLHRTTYVINTHWNIKMTFYEGECIFIHGSRAPEFTPGFQWGSCYSIFSFMYNVCRSLFVLLSFFFWPLCCLSFDLWILITPLVSSNSSYCAMQKSSLF
jgi:hypothetical protein